MPSFFDYYHNALKTKHIFYVLGAQGSGTNLICNLMRQTLDFSVVQDRSLIFNAAVRIHKRPTEANIARQCAFVCSRLFPSRLRRRIGQKSYHNQGHNYEGIVEHLSDAKIRSAREFLYFFYSYQAFQLGKKHLAVKSDDIWESISHLQPILGDPRYILNVRDCRDNALSIANKPWGPKTLYRTSRYVKHRLDAYWRETATLPDQTVVVKYEQILTDPEAAVQKLASTFGLELTAGWEDELQQLQIRRTNFNKWKRMKPADVSVCEAVLKDCLQRHGYEMACADNPKLTVWQAGADYFRDMAMRAPQKLRSRGRKLLGL